MYWYNHQTDMFHLFFLLLSVSYSSAPLGGTIDPNQFHALPQSVPTQESVSAFFVQGKMVKSWISIKKSLWSGFSAWNIFGDGCGGNPTLPTSAVFAVVSITPYLPSHSWRVLTSNGDCQTLSGKMSLTLAVWLMSKFFYVFAIQSCITWEKFTFPWNCL